MFFGDVVGRPGRETVRDALPQLKERFKPDFIIANVENIAGGSGVTAPTVQKIFAYGVNVCTTGDHIFRNKEFIHVIYDPRLLRPANLPTAALGKGWNVYQTSGGETIMVLNLLGRIFMEPNRCPFEAADEALAAVAALPRKPRVIVADMHAEATSEKCAIGRHLDGRVSAVVGSHTHVQTADDQILPGGTAYLTDLGMCGSHHSIIGREIQPVLQKLRTGMPARFEVASGGRKACGAVIRVETSTGKAVAVERFQEPVAEPPKDVKEDENGNSSARNRVNPPADARRANAGSAAAADA
jgi:hypothetical protein